MCSPPADLVALSAIPMDEPRASERGPEPAAALSVDERRIFDALRAWRGEVAKELGWPAFRVASNRTLSAIAQAAPRDERRAVGRARRGPVADGDPRPPHPRASSRAARAEVADAEREYPETRMCEFVFPGDTNHLGTLYGGTLMAWMDSAAAVAAVRRAGTAAVVTAAVETLTFRVVIRQGELVELVATRGVGGAHEHEGARRGSSRGPGLPHARAVHRGRSSRWSRWTRTAGPRPCATRGAGPPGRAA